MAILPLRDDNNRRAASRGSCPERRLRPERGRPLLAAARRRLASAAFGSKPRLQNWFYEYGL